MHAADRSDLHRQVTDVTIVFETAGPEPGSFCPLLRNDEHVQSGLAQPNQTDNKCHTSGETRWFRLESDPGPPIALIRQAMDEKEWSSR